MHGRQGFASVAGRSIQSLGSEMTQPRVFKLVARSIRRPSVWNEAAHPVDYFKDNFNGQPLPPDWKPPAHYIRGGSYGLSDCISWELPRPLLSERARRVIDDVAPNCAEFRHFADIKGKPYFVLNVLASDDVLDEESSEVTRSASGEIVTVVRYAFCRAPSIPLFKLPSRFSSDTLCTEAIAEAVVENKLTGFGFWDPLQPTLSRLFLGEDLNCYPGVAA
jgi:hypothetical protein